MEIINENNPEGEEKSKYRYKRHCYENDEHYERNHKISKVFIGVAVITAGVLLLMKRTGSAIPHWVLTWPMILIVGGIASGIKHGWKRPAAYILMVIGGIFLSDKIVGGAELRPYIWPVAIMIIGVVIIFKPRRKHNWKKWEQKWHEKKKSDMSEGTAIEANAVFGSVQRNIISKTFKGGEVNCVFGGAEINFMQADIEEKAELELNCVFGSCKIIVPSHWQIKSELDAVFGGVEDKRMNQSANGGEQKILLLKGSCVFGGIEIKSY
ncbi:MAG: hypothetical protein IAF38_02240 [Bacteroidia bacterium]|nr:hypothetical protein [Bacteroidia bacterium]